MKFLALLALVCVSCTGQELTIDELIAGASKVKELNYLTDLSSNMIMQELDMLLTLDQYRKLHGVGKNRNKRKAIRETRYRWTDKIIPYKMRSGVFDERDMNEIQKAMDDWQKYTCIRFTEATTHTNFVFFDDASGCYSYVGMVGGSQTIGLAGGCRHKGVIAHEIGHAVGFHHEQNRPDRDRYVRILKENIPESVLYNFVKYEVDAVNNYDVPYDYNSVMHYGGRAFSTNGKLTIQTLNSADQDKIGNREGLSFHDIQLANLMYSCNSHCSSEIRCPSHGFMGKDCKCYCPGSPVQSCDAETGTEGATKPPTEKPVTTKRPCLDVNDNCPDWANAGFCPTHSYLQMYCKKSCNLCEGETTKTTTRTTLPPCLDEREHCGFWSEQGFCKGEYEAFMRNHCKKSCDYCQTTDTEASGSGSESHSDGNGSAQLVPRASTVWSLACVLSLVMIYLNSRSSYL